MGMKKKRSASSAAKTSPEAPEQYHTDAGCVTTAVDQRPESSPYAGAIIGLQLKDGTVLKIPSPILQRCPKLHNNSYDSYNSPWSTTIHLDVTQEVGHVLVHYLFTDTYQRLRPKESSLHEKIAAEFTTSIRVYTLAREYELSSLKELAKLEIGRLGSELRFPVVLDLVREAYPEPSADDTWFSSYLSSGLKSLLRNPTELSDCVSQNAERKTFSVGDLLFKNLVELINIYEIAPRGLDTSPQLEALEELASDGDAKVDPEPETCPEGDTIAEPEPETCPGGDAIAEPEPEKSPGGDAIAEPEPETCPGGDAIAEPEPEPEPKPADDGWIGWDINPKKTKKKKKMAAVFDDEPVLATKVEPADDGWTTRVIDSKPAKEDNWSPAKEDSWSLCESDSKEAKPETLCEFRTEHVIRNGWEECSSCREYIRRLSGRLS